MVHSVGAGARAELVRYEGVRGPQRGNRSLAGEVTVRVLSEKNLLKAVGAVAVLDGDEGRGRGLDQLTGD